MLTMDRGQEMVTAVSNRGRILESLRPCKRSHSLFKRCSALGNLASEEGLDRIDDTRIKRSVNCSHAWAKGDSKLGRNAWRGGGCASPKRVHRVDGVDDLGSDCSRP